MAQNESPRAAKRRLKTKSLETPTLEGAEVHWYAAKAGRIQNAVTDCEFCDVIYTSVEQPPKQVQVFVSDVGGVRKANFVFFDTGAWVNRREISAQTPFEGPPLSQIEAEIDAEFKEVEGGTAEEEGRGLTEALLAAAMEPNDVPDQADASTALDEVVFKNALELLGNGAGIGSTVRTELDLLRAIVKGFPAGVLSRLRELGFQGEIIERTVAPKRTLARRKALHQRLTQAESDAAWRLAHVLALARHVLSDGDAAWAWLYRPKPALGDAVPIELLDTAVGARAVERLLRQLEWGLAA